ncbi:DUF2057 family protein [Lonsdalea quercina]
MMKFKFAFICLSLVMCATPAMATTLKLGPDVELIVVDGRKVPASLLKGAGSLELNGGDHQLLFRVSKTIDVRKGMKEVFHSNGLIATFNTHNQSAITIHLPDLSTPKLRKQFKQKAHYQLMGDNNQLISATTDRITLTEADLSGDIEKKMIAYNSAAHPASVPALTALPPSQPVMPPAKDVNAEPLTPAADKTDPFILMQYWFQKADQKTRQRFLQWAAGKDGQ